MKNLNKEMAKITESHSSKGKSMTEGNDEREKRGGTIQHDYKIHDSRCKATDIKAKNDETAQMKLLKDKNSYERFVLGKFLKLH